MMRRGIMDDPDDDPVVLEKDVPSFDVVDQKIKELDNTIIVYRIYYFFNRFVYRFQLIKKNKMCMIEIPRNLLENMHTNGGSAEQELSNIITSNIDNEECWTDFNT
jgi:hypothetical protein